MTSYRGYIRHICEHLGEKPVKSITTADVQRAYNVIKRSGRSKEHPIYGKSLSNTYIRSLHMVLHQIMDDAVSEHLTAKNPTCGTTVPKRDYKEKVILNKNQFDTFMDAIEKEPLWFDFFYTEMTTGL